MAEVVIEIASLVARAGAKVAFGEKVEVDGATLVPVALAVYGFGGGSGEGATGPETETPSGRGSGGGGGAFSVPLGAYVGHGGTVRFVPNVVAVLGVAIPLTFVVGQAAARVARTLR